MNTWAWCRVADGETGMLRKLNIIEPGKCYRGGTKGEHLDAQVKLFQEGWPACGEAVSRLGVTLIVPMFCRPRAGTFLSVERVLFLFTFCKVIFRPLSAFRVILFLHCVQ